MACPIMSLMSTDIYLFIVSFIQIADIKVFACDLYIARDKGYLHVDEIFNFSHKNASEIKTFMNITIKSFIFVCDSVSQKRTTFDIRSCTLTECFAWIDVCSSLNT